VSKKWWFFFFEQFFWMKLSKLIRKKMKIIIFITFLINLVNSEVPDGVCHNEENCVEKTSSCINFDLNNFGPQSKSIFYGEARGRLGNQLLGFALLHHFRQIVGVDAYIHGSAKEYITKVFTNGKDKRLR